MGYRNKDQAKLFPLLLPPPNANASFACWSLLWVLREEFNQISQDEGEAALWLPSTDSCRDRDTVRFLKKNWLKKGKAEFDF